MERSERTASLLLLALSITACRTVPPPAQVDPAAVGAARFPGAGAILAGFDAAEAGADWRAGDRLLYALSTESGARTRTKLVEIELLGACTLKSASGEAGPVQLVESEKLTATVGSHEVEWSSTLLRVAVRVYEADGRLVQHTEAKVPETVLRSGMHPALELCSELEARIVLAGTQPAELSDRDTRVFGEALAMLPALLGILQDHGVLESLLMQAVGPPPLLSILRGIQVQVSCDFRQAGPVTHPATLPCVPGSIYRVPLHLAVNDDPRLDMELEVAAADPPLRLSGGILALRGVACRSPERKVTFELLAARRGPPGAEIRL